MKKTITCLVVVLSLGQFGREVSGQVLNPYDTLKYDKVIAYDYNGEAWKEIVKNGVLFKRIELQRELTPKMVKKMHAWLGDSTSYGGGTAACFDPHLGIVYYRKGSIVGYISICLDCNFLVSSMKIPAMKGRVVMLDSGVVIRKTGFTKKARKSIGSFCRELGFNHCKNDWNEIYD